MRSSSFISALVLLQFWIAPAYSQVNLSDMDLGSTDSLRKSRIRYFSPGGGGRNKVWNFSKKLGSNEKVL